MGQHVRLGERAEENVGWGIGRGGRAHRTVPSIWKALMYLSALNRRMRRKTLMAVMKSGLSSTMGRAEIQ